MAKLCDVFPDGRSLVLANGAVRARYRNSLLEPELVTPGKVYEFVVDLTHTSNLFKAGHRLRIDIVSSDFPLQDRNMNTGNEFGEDAVGEVAVQTIFHDTRYPSYIDLPFQPTD